MGPMNQILLMSKQEKLNLYKTQQVQLFKLTIKHQVNLFYPAHRMNLKVTLRKKMKELRYLTLLLLQSQKDFL